MEDFAIARPYVKAIISVAAEDGDYASWEKMLGFLSMIAVDKCGRNFLQDRSVSAEEKVVFLCNLRPDVLNRFGENFIKILAHSKRLMLLPSIYSLYKILLLEIESKLDVYLRVAKKTSLDVGAEIGRNIPSEQINITEEVVPNLIAGGVARIGNHVVDGSYKGQLALLHAFIVSE